MLLLLLIYYNSSNYLLFIKCYLNNFRMDLNNNIEEIIDDVLMDQDEELIPQNNHNIEQQLAQEYIINMDVDEPLLENEIVNHFEENIHDIENVDQIMNFNEEIFENNNQNNENIDQVLALEEQIIEEEINDYQVEDYERYEEKYEEYLYSNILNERLQFLSTCINNFTDDNPKLYYSNWSDVPSMLQLEIMKLIMYRIEHENLNVNNMTDDEYSSYLTFIANIIKNL